MIQFNKRQSFCSSALRGCAAIGNPGLVSKPGDPEEAVNVEIFWIPDHVRQGGLVRNDGLKDLRQILLMEELVILVILIILVPWLAGHGQGFADGIDDVLIVGVHEIQENL